MISESSYAGFWNKEPDMNIGNEIQPFQCESHLKIK